jgi:hypothetical protein
MIVGNKIQLGIDRSDGQLVVRVGPFEEGGGNRVIEASALGDLPPVLERLTEERRVESSAGFDLVGAGEEDLLRDQLVVHHSGHEVPLEEEEA